MPTMTSECIVHLTVCVIPGIYERKELDLCVRMRKILAISKISSAQRGHTHRFTVVELCARMAHLAHVDVFAKLGLDSVGKEKLRGGSVDFCISVPSPSRFVRLLLHGLLDFCLFLLTGWRSAGKSLTLRMARKEQCEFWREGEHTLESAKLKTTSTTLGPTTETDTSVITRVKDYYYKVRHHARPKMHNSVTLHKYRAALIPLRLVWAPFVFHTPYLPSE